MKKLIAVAVLSLACAFMAGMLVQEHQNHDELFLCRIITASMSSAVEK